MATKKDTVEIQTTLGEREKHARPLIALVLMTFAVLVLAALLDYDAMDNPYLNSDRARGQLEHEENMVGLFGTHVSYQVFRWLGYCAWVLPVFILRFAILAVYKKAQFLKLSRVFAAIACLIALTGLAAMFQTSFDAAASNAVADYVDNPSSPYARYTAGPGGVIGHSLYQVVMQNALGPFGSGMLYVMAALAFGVPVLFTQPTVFFHNARERFSCWVDKRLAEYREGSEERKQQRALEREARKKEKEEEAERKAEAKARTQEEAEKQQAIAKQAETEADKPAPKAEKKEVQKKTLAEMPLEPDEDVIKETPKPRKVAAASKGDVLGTTDKAETPAKTGGLKIIEGEVVEKAEGHLPQRQGKYVFPDLTLLSDPPPKVSSSENYEETAHALVQTLSQFKVDVELGEIHSGPVITRYEVVPAPGVRVNKIETLDKDLALGLKAQSVRILAPVPGKGTVGIEVPNRHAQPVCIRDIIESRAWAESNADIPIVLGKEVTGKPVVTDLTKAPHMLIAGSTGSGKSVCINSIIASLLYKMSPDDLRFIMVDPKVVELKMYNVLPHMLVPVVTDPKKVPGALKYLIKEMEYRFQVFAECNVRNIAGFNAKILKDKASREKAESLDAEMSPEERAAMNSVEVPRDKDVELHIPKEKLPYIVCIIDELADLMMVAPADIEASIMRLTQLARAAGIHVILATQRPSVNVITGVIKSNIPMRIAFKVASNTDSRTILDSKGAEALIGKGDMLFTGNMNMTRAQGAFVSDEEIGELVDFIHEKNGAPIFDETIQKQIEAEGEDGDGGSGAAEGDYDDPLVPQAIDVIKNSKRASTSMLQRRLKIGYNRAARIMELLEDEGIVGPENGSSPREILMDDL